MRLATNAENPAECLDVVIKEEMDGLSIGWSILARGCVIPLRVHQLHVTQIAQRGALLAEAHRPPQQNPTRCIHKTSRRWRPDRLIAQRHRHQLGQHVLVDKPNRHTRIDEASVHLGNIGGHHRVGRLARLFGHRHQRPGFHPAQRLPGPGAIMKRLIDFKVDRLGALAGKPVIQTRRILQQLFFSQHKGIQLMQLHNTAVLCRFAGRHLVRLAAPVSLHPGAAPRRTLIRRQRYRAAVRWLTVNLINQVAFSKHQLPNFLTHCWRRQIPLASATSRLHLPRRSRPNQQPLIHMATRSAGLAHR